MGLLDILGRMGSGISNGTRNVVQRIPGGADTFPLEANGTVNWIGNPVRGDNVLGSMFRGATGIDAAESAGNFLFGNRDQPEGVTSPAGNFARDRDRISRAAMAGAGSRPGSVVGRGFIGRRSQLGPTSAGVGRPASYPGDGIGLPQSQRDQNWQMPGTDAPPPPPGPFSGAQASAVGAAGVGNAGRQGVDGRQVARIGLLAQQQGLLMDANEHNERIRTRGGTQAEY